jgi:hypothetical protein
MLPRVSYVPPGLKGVEVKAVCIAGGTVNDLSVSLAVLSMP